MATPKTFLGQDQTLHYSYAIHFQYLDDSLDDIERQFEDLFAHPILTDDSTDCSC